ncbi:MAG: hypothetical protein GTO02_14035 [Candidatus Dadabacteria bacterium]|nr:hypothetical protein [Candidatus Dadabacteria bacterium]NIQ15468.1 hypothetical protein [Candidatus Dadabacteria bacterium]
MDGANQADIVAFVYEDDRSISGFQGDEIDDDTDFEHLIYNETAGASFEVFLVDENEERVSCGIKNFACGPNKIMNYGINKDIPASRGDNLLCNSAGLDPGQTNGYVSLERPSFVSSINNILLAESVAGVSVGGVETSFEFVCLVGLNNGNGTGSMDTCQYKCAEGDSDCRED